MTEREKWKEKGENETESPSIAKEMRETTLNWRKKVRVDES